MYSFTLCTLIVTEESNALLSSEKTCGKTGETL